MRETPAVAAGPTTSNPTKPNPAIARHPRPLGGDPVKTLKKPVVSLTGMVINNQPGQQLADKKKPSWLKAKVPGGQAYHDLRKNIEGHGLHTVCQEAGCPNMGECWSRGVATIMILGDTCTRSCGFCNVKSGRPVELDKDEPRRVAESLALMDLKHVVITSVNRDELTDGGAGIWAETILRAKEACRNMSIEVLTPDFMGNWAALQMVIDAQPHIINHNIECVKRMYPAVRPSARYERSIEFLRRCKEQGVVAKTGIMVGIGERDEEVIELMAEVVEETAKHDGKRDQKNPHRGDPIDILTIGQYLQPTRNHLPIDRWVHPDTFAMYAEEGKKLGWKVVESGPLVRSSYHADMQANELTSIESERAGVAKVNELIGRAAD